MLIDNTSVRVEIDGNYVGEPNAYIAPKNGTITVRVDSTTTNGLRVGNVWAIYPTPNTGIWSTSIPVKKGTKIYWTSSMTYTASNHNAAFYYTP